MNKDFLIASLKYSPLALGILILGVGAAFVPWRDVLPYFSRLSPISYIAIVVLGLSFYGIRVVRYHYMLGVLKTPLSFSKTLIAYFTAQPIALLPAGEAYRVITLKEHGNVPKSKGISIVFIQSFTENIAMISLALVCATTQRSYFFIVLALLLLYFCIFVFVRTKRTAEKSHRYLTKLPFVNFARSKLHLFIDRNKTLLSGKSLVVLLLSGFISTLLASLLLFIVANDLGVAMDFPHAVIAYTLPMVLQNISFLPGGIGINEQGTVGLLVLFGATLPAAVAITIIMRFVTLAMGVIIGLFSLVAVKTK